MSVASDIVLSSEIVLSIVPGALPDAKLQKLVEHFDWALDNPMGTQTPVADSGLLEAIGGELWARSGITSAAWLREQLDAAPDAERAVRLVVAGEEHQRLPWELLHHPELGFVTQHPWCTLVRRAKGKGTKVPLSLPRPFRILLFVASPEDLDGERGRLDYEKEEELLFSALDRQLAAR